MKKTLKEFLKKHEACEDGFRFAKDLTLEEFLETCPRGDWILWLFQKSSPNSLRELTLAKAHCANTVRHLMKDERSIKAVDVAIAFGNGEASKDELRDAADAADAAAYAAAYAAADVAAYAAADAAADVADVVAYAAAAYAAYAAAYAAAVAAADVADVVAGAAAYTARKANQKTTADICRKYLKIELWEIGKKSPRKTRSDKGKSRKKRKETTHIRIETAKKPFLVRLAKKPITFIKSILGENE